MTVPSMKDEKFIKENNNSVYFYSLKKLDKDLIVKVPDSASVFFEKSLFKCLLNFHGNQTEKTLDYATEYGYVDANIQTLLNTVFPDDGTGKFYIETKQNNILVPYTIISTQWTKGDWLLDGKGSSSLQSTLKYGPSYTEYNPSDFPLVDESLNPEAENPMINKDFLKPEAKEEEKGDVVPTTEATIVPTVQRTIVSDEGKITGEGETPTIKGTVVSDTGIKSDEANELLKRFYGSELEKSFKFFGETLPVGFDHIFNSYKRMVDELDLNGLIELIQDRIDGLKSRNKYYFLVEDIIQNKKQPEFDPLSKRALDVLDLSVDETPNITIEELRKRFKEYIDEFYFAYENKPLFEKIDTTISKLKEINRHYDVIYKTRENSPTQFEYMKEGYRDMIERKQKEQKQVNITKGGAKESNEIKLAKEHLEDVTRRQNGPLAYYITVFLELEKGSSLSPEQMKELRCRKVWSSVQKSYAELMGQTYEPTVDENNAPTEEETKPKVVLPSPPPTQAQKGGEVAGEKRNRKYRHLFRL
jgi:hypothetical protein